MSFNLIYPTPMGGSYFIVGFIRKNMENFGEKNCCFSMQIRLDWENNAWLDTAGLGSIG